jgi:hypothetical protein
MIKQSHYRPGQALRVPGGWGFQIFKTIGTWWWQGCQPSQEVEASRYPDNRRMKVTWPQSCAPVAFTPQEMFLVLISIRDWVDPRAIVRPEGLYQWKILMTPSEIEPATFQLRHRVPPVVQLWLNVNLNRQDIINKKILKTAERIFSIHLSRQG